VCYFDNNERIPLQGGGYLNTLSIIKQLQNVLLSWGAPWCFPPFQIGEELYPTYLYLSVADILSQRGVKKSVKRIYSIVIDL